MISGDTSVFLNEHDRIFKAVSLAGKKLGVPVYVVGGSVRDALLGRPCKDLDFVCTGDGIELARTAARILKPGIQPAVFKNYGTAAFPFDGFELEFVGARKESYTPESRNPEVQEGTLEDDQMRRDFTINAMAISLNEGDYGQLLDPFQGLEDLKAGVIKTPTDPDITFSDDPLRMMRAVRFANQLNFYIQEETWEALKRNCLRIEIISAERITEEMNKILRCKKPSYGFVMLDECGIFPIIFPEFVRLKGAEEKEGIGHKDNFSHTLQVLDNLCKTSDDLWLRWAAVLHDIAKPATKKFEAGEGWTFHGHEVVGAKWVPGIFKRFRLPLDAKMKFVQKMVLLHLRPISLTKEEITDSAIRRLLFEAGDDIDELMKLCEADITSKNKGKVQRYLHRFAQVRIKLKEVEEKDRIRNFQPPISGELIMKTYGIRPGPEIGIIKSEIKEAILDGKIRNDYDEAYALMQQLAAKLGLHAIS